MHKQLTIIDERVCCIAFFAVIKKNKYFYFDIFNIQMYVFFKCEIKYLFTVDQRPRVPKSVHPQLLAQSPCPEKRRSTALRCSRPVL